MTDQSRLMVTVVDSGIRFPVVAGQSVLHSMSRTGIKGIPSGCYGGGCGICKIQVLSGRYTTGKMSRDQVSEAEQDAGQALACKTFADQDLTIRVLGKINRALERASG